MELFMNVEEVMRKTGEKEKHQQTEGVTGKGENMEDPIGNSQASVSSFLTSIVLLVGVFTGLIIVVVVILVCKYCHGRGKAVRRHSFGSSGRDTLSERNFRDLQRYETINSDFFSDQSNCSTDGQSITPKKNTDFRFATELSLEPEATETTRLKSDYEKGNFSLQDKTREEGFSDSPGKRQDDDSASPMASTSNVSNGALSNGSRYIEGDFHHLKHTKIGRTIPRQFSMGGPGSAIPDRMFLDNPQLRFSSLDERHTVSFNHPHGEVASQNEATRAFGETRQSSLPQSHSILSQYYLQQQQQQQHSLQPLQQQQPSHPQLSPSSSQSFRDQKRLNFIKDRESPPKQGREVHSHDLQRTGNDRRGSGTPSPTYTCSPRSIKKSPSPTFTFVKEGLKLSPSPPFKTVRESNSTSPLAWTPPREVPENEGSSSLFCPIKEFTTENSPSPPYKPVRTQVAVEVHQQLQNAADAISNNSAASDEQHQHLVSLLERARSGVEPVALRNVPLSKTKGQQKTTYSNSMETSNPTHHFSYRDSRKVKSYDDYTEDHDVLKITEFSKGPFYNTEYDAVAELGSPSVSKVRYNDTGSLEQLNEDDPDCICDLEFPSPAQAEEHKDDDLGGADTEGSSSTLNGNRKYRALWRLRATLEEEEECSDTVRMEDMTSPDDSPDREHATPNTTSFESNALSDPCPSDHRDSGIQFEACMSAKQPNQANFLHPNYEHRRQNYRNVMSNRLQRGNQSTSVENSFDSVETDGDVSDTSRYEVTTTSFESTTDNTDSTTESQACRLQQMKADSGYKSLEAQHQNSKEMVDSELHQNGHGSKDTRRELLRSNLDKNCNNLKHQHAREAEEHVNPADAAASDLSGHRDPRDCATSLNAGNFKSAGIRKSPPNTSHFDRRNGKTASKKRREYSSRERQVIHVYESINEPETDSRSDLHSGDSFEDSSIPNKASLFTRFFKSHPRGNKSQYLVRDYSIDEKTNSIFNEFVRQEIPASSRDHGGNGRLGVRRSPRMQRHRLQRKHTEPAFLSEDRLTRRDRLAPAIRSASLGSDSSASSARRISPQDSIEEEEDGMDEAMATASSSALNRYSTSACSLDKPREASFLRQLKTMDIRDIPIIKLPDDECQDNP